jgi:formamidopyrimidine-DNA glycosylase
MPELPEVEVTKRGISDFCLGQRINAVITSGFRLRYPIPDLQNLLPGQEIKSITRRGKYIIMHVNDGFLLIHLGMSGRFSMSQNDSELQKHEHVRFCLQNGRILSYFDQRRFGLLLWEESEISEHRLIKNLGVEPLTDKFDTEYLYNLLRNRKGVIKNVIMNSNLIVGVGNIYASEALFRAGIKPMCLACSVSEKKSAKLCTDIKAVLQEAIVSGGTTIRDFKNHHGEIGYFKQKLKVYGRAGEKCFNCVGPIKNIKIGGRSSFYCNNCQS